MEIRIEDFQKANITLPKDYVADDKDKKIRELESYIVILKRRLNGQKKNTKGLLNKLKRERGITK